ncbi:OmpP1/FadL family transporter [Sulfurimonas marina]|uniref:Aromatic hydrocarbon degradation protein n=1 Tax=Sulfurimonas marina TaxID=2590551 RepID=A0A7M1AWZ8_9BACT|nr:outer membrane protein transport protein [Sulfurimonas marina]QOP41979.1 aromatic hydrocarbon degradation protein [Sulfurimonas marina]
MRKAGLLSIITATALMASGYKIPETSSNAVALGAATIAHNHENADASYYNPAKMVFMKDTNHLEVNLMYIGLDKIKYEGTVSGAGPSTWNLESEKEDFLVPSLHYVSPKLGDNGARIGVSVVVPGGLSKRWQSVPANNFAEEFSLEIVEINPTVAFQVTDKLGFAFGFRVIDTKGVVNNAYYDMEGDSTDYGYNLALAYQPTSDLELGLTYRSNINLNVNGTTTKVLAGNNGGVDVSVPLPAALSVAAAYTLPSDTTIEVVYEKTFWSAYNSLDFSFEDPTANIALGNSIEKDWKDTNAFRLGVTQELTDLTIMAGLVIDQTSAPERTVGFELPGTDTRSVALGGRYKINETFDFGVSALYSVHKSRTVQNDTLDGEFTEGNVLLVSAGLGYKF